MAVQDSAYKRVYVWELPVRFYHWINAICIVILCITGYIIGNPPVISSSREAFQQYWFGTVRFIHFVFAFLFFFNFILRIYWGFSGNKYSRWTNFIPFKKDHFKEIGEVLKIDILQTDLKGKLHVGHNMLAGFTYFLTALVFVFHSLTGFALYSRMSGSFFPKLFAWVIPLMGGDLVVRQWHHMLMWFFVVFAIVHIYLVFYHDYIEGRGTTSSMVGGWKFEKEENLD